VKLRRNRGGRKVSARTEKRILYGPYGCLCENECQNKLDSGKKKKTGKLIGDLLPWGTTMALDETPVLLIQKETLRD